MNQIRTTRFSGADWASELRNILLIGVGGIGSWTALNLSRIGHYLTLVDGDNVDETNVNGGQLYRMSDIGKSKATAVHEICREFGCINHIETYDVNYNYEDFGIHDIVICGLDNMKARKEVFNAWKSETSEGLFIDGRLLMENMEIFAINAKNPEQKAKYEEEYLFDDEEVAELDCTTKQSTFGAMIISGIITSTLCNYLTNCKLEMEFREVPFHQKFYLPLLSHKSLKIEIPEYA